jgi:hypothetical protein
MAWHGITWHGMVLCPIIKIYQCTYLCFGFFVVSIVFDAVYDVYAAGDVVV